MRTAIRRYMAKTFFATAWADWVAQYGEGTPGMGVDIMDLVPDEYPQSAYAAADDLIAGMEKLNGASLETIFKTCQEEPGFHRREPDEDEFGYCMAMQSMGHGVGWDDCHPSMFHNSGIGDTRRIQRFDTPWVDYSYFDLPEAEYPIPAGEP